MRRPRARIEQSNAQQSSRCKTRGRKARIVGLPTRCCLRNAQTPASTFDQLWPTTFQSGASVGQAQSQFARSWPTSAAGERKALKRCVGSNVRACLERLSRGWCGGEYCLGSFRVFRRSLWSDVRASCKHVRTCESALSSPQAAVRKATRRRGHLCSAPIRVSGPRCS